VETYGSLATGLDAPCSDIDLVVRGVPPEQSWGSASTAHSRLATALRSEACERAVVSVICAVCFD
jgi:DNA polymerase sigma